MGKTINMLVLLVLLVAGNCYAGSTNYVVRQLTFDDIDHDSVSASSSGEVIWTQDVGGYSQVFSMSLGQLTFDKWDHISPDVNSQGEIVYIKRLDDELPVVYSSLRGEVAKGDVALPRVNDDGEIIWREKRDLGYVFVSSIRGEVVIRPTQGADISNDGEIVYIGNSSTGELELFSNRKGQISSGLSGRTPRINNIGEITWEKEVTVGKKTFRQIFSNTRGNITEFFDGDTIRLGNVDDRGVVYFTGLKNGHFQIFSATPKETATMDETFVSKPGEEPVVETYKTPDNELFSAINKMDSFKDRSGPTLIISEPKDNSAVDGVVKISVFSYEQDSLAHCYLQIDEKYLGWDETPPFEFIWNTQYWRDGDHIITVVGHFEDSSNPTQVASVFVRSQNDRVMRPSLAILSPRNGETINGTITINTDATSDNFSYVYSEVDVGFKDWDNMPPYAFTLDTHSLPNGRHTIKVYGWHKQGGESVEDVVSVVVSN
ncbi:MAG: hypothetical protein JW800_06425 [Candidatus Omnitrophica bacterium]|nr:hypothetical protein [Candidatus Omnitrophota bacterium]